LAFERKPEFMGWSQTEPTTKTNLTAYNHFYFGDEAQKRIDKYNRLEGEVKKLRTQMSSKEADAFFQLVYYPVTAASLINKKFLYRDKSYLYAKQNRLSANAYLQGSRDAYDSIVKETTYFNTQVAGGKWNHVMSMQPRELPVYLEPVFPAISIDSTNGWSIAPEGFVTEDSSLEGNVGSLSLPAFDNLNRQKYFVDIFLEKNQQINWTASSPDNWIRLSKKTGVLGAQQGDWQMRLWVDVDWNKMNKKGRMKGKITFAAGGKQMTVTVEANKVALAGFKGFVEDNGFVSIQATHFTRQSIKLSNRWKMIDGLGYAGSALEAFPLVVNRKSLTNPDAIKRSNAVVEYDFYTFSPATPFVNVFALPTHPINNNFSVRYAVSIDNGPLKTVDIRTVGRSEEWKQNVLRNRAERKIKMPFLTAGKHTLKIFCIDPGVILDEILIDLGGLKKAYSSVPETKIQVTSN